MPRLAEHPGGAVEGESAVRWAVEGTQVSRAGQTPAIWLHVKAQAAIARTCQRCMHPMLVELAVDQRIRFVEGEDAAARLDAEVEEDVLPLQAAINLAELIEDELLLALPVIPKHDRCPEAWPGLGAAEASPPDVDDARDNPFAVLAALKRPPQGHND